MSNLPLINIKKHMKILNNCFAVAGDDKDVALFLEFMRDEIDTFLRVRQAIAVAVKSKDIKLNIDET